MATTIEADFNALPIRRDYTLLQGDGWEQPLTLQINGVAENLTGCSVALAVRDEDKATVTVTYSAVEMDSTNTGQFTPRLMPADTAAWVAGSAYYYNVQATWPVADGTFAKGQTKTILHGTLQVQDDAQ